MSWTKQCALPLLVVASMSSQATATWDDRFGFAGPHGDFDGPIHELFVDGNSVYVAGAFEHVDGMPVDGIVRWTGGGWDPMGSPNFDGFDGEDEVFVIAKYMGDIVVAGMFDSVNGQPANVARWDGGAWSSMGEWLTPGQYHRDINALHADGSDLYIAGEFDGLVIHFDGTTAASIVQSSSSNLHPGNETRVWDLCTYDGDLIAVGEFAQIDENVFWYVARWDGAQWNAMAGGSPTTHLLDVFVEQGVLYVESYDEIWAWTGSAWDLVTDVASGCTAVMSEFAEALFFQGNLYRSGVGGSVLPELNGVARWTGSAWDDMRGGVEPMDYCAWLAPSLAEYDDRLLIGGQFTEVRGIPASNLVSWTGDDWYLSAPNDVVRSVLSHEGDVYVGGDFTHVLGLPAGGVAKWSGYEWSTLGVGVEGSVHALLFHGGDLYAGGDITGPGGIDAIARWDGAAWNPVGAGTFSGGIRALASDGVDLFAGGDFTLTDGMDVIPRVARWDGVDWHGLGGGVTIGTVLAMEFLGSELFVGGSFTQVEGVPYENIARWDGSSWSQAWFGHSLPVRAMTIHQGELIVGGDFPTVPGSAEIFGRVARWDGTQWQPVSASPQLSGPVHGLASTGTKLVAVGTFGLAGGLSAKRIAAWDGVNWISFGGGADAPVRAVAASPNEFWIGGDFLALDGTGSSHFGHWVDAATAVPPQRGARNSVRLGEPYPNPFNPSVTIGYELEIPSQVELYIYDVAGRRVRTLVAGKRLPAGDYTASWDGRTDGGAQAASGVYYLQLRAGEASDSRRLVLLK